MALVYLTKGKRGKIYVDKNRAVKKSTSDHVSNEVLWLKILNKKKIGPKLISSSKNSFSYCFVKGEFLPEWIGKQKSKKEVLKVLKKVLEQCRIMDQLRMNKLEMHNPYKHIIVKRSSQPVLIDFERCYETEKPKNTTQFCQYLTGKLTPLLIEKGIKLKREKFTILLQDYKHTYSDADFKKILKAIDQ
jgi:predicted Ser/Thr protein kinase